MPHFRVAGFARETTIKGKETVKVGSVGVPMSKALGEYAVSAE
jgi:hypothetical protein